MDRLSDIFWAFKLLGKHCDKHIKKESNFKTKQLFILRKIRFQYKGNDSPWTIGFMSELLSLSTDLTKSCD